MLLVFILCIFLWFESFTTGTHSNICIIKVGFEKGWFH